MAQKLAGFKWIDSTMDWLAFVIGKKKILESQNQIDIFWVKGNVFSVRENKCIKGRFSLIEEWADILNTAEGKLWICTGFWQT